MPLKGIKIIDFTRALAGPYCTMLLGDLGANIIKIEVPNKGDDSRTWGPPFLKNQSAYFLSINRNKKSLTLNLKKDEAKEIAKKIILKSDILIENYRPGTMEKLGLDYETIKNIKKDIIYCSISGFGQNGPYKNLPGFDQVLQGMGGIMSLTGEPEGQPMKVGLAISDIAAGMFASNAILAALYKRAITKEGEYIDISLLDCQASWMSYQAQSFLLTGELPKRVGTGHPVIVPYQAFKAKDGYINIAIGNDSQWKEFCNITKLTNISNDPNFIDNPNRVKNRKDCVNKIQEVIEKKNVKDWVEIFRKTGIPAGPVYNMKELFSDAQLEHRNMKKIIKHQEYGEVTQVGTPFKLKNSECEIKLPPPTLGEHNEEILKELGYTNIDELKNKGII